MIITYIALWCSGNTEVFDTYAESSTLSGAANFAGLAQMVVQRFRKPSDEGSSPLFGSRYALIAQSGRVPDGR